MTFVYQPRSVTLIEARLAKAQTEPDWDDERVVPAAKFEPRMDSRLVVGFSSLSAVRRMLGHLGFEEEMITKILDNGGTFPLTNGFGSICRSPRTGMFGCFLHAGKPPRGKPTATTLGELYAVIEYGAHWRGRARLPAQARHYFDRRLAYLSGVVSIERSPLPAIPDTVLRQLRSEAEVAYAVALIEEFGIRLDLSREFVPRAHANALGLAVYSRSFRELLFNDAPRADLIDQIEREAKGTRRSQRSDQIWKLLAPNEDREQALIMRVIGKGVTLYRWGLALPRRFDAAAVLQDALRRFSQIRKR